MLVHGWGKGWLSDFATFHRVLKHCWRRWFCKPGVTFTKPQRTRSADPAAEMGCNCTCRAGRERGTGTATGERTGWCGEHRGNSVRLLQAIPMKGISRNRYKPLLPINCDWFFFPRVISLLPPTPSKVSLGCITDTAFLWGYWTSPEQGEKDSWVFRLLCGISGYCYFFSIPEK